MWHGGWCWEKVTPLLRAGAHDVHSLTLTGLGELAHLRSDDIDLYTHVQDVVNLFEDADLRNVILVGHSLGGFMAPIVAEEIPERIAHIVSIDGMIPENGKSLKDLIGDTWDFFKSKAIESGDEWWCPPIREWTFGLSGADLEWTRAKLTPHPLKTLATIVGLENPRSQSVPRTFISCSEGLSADKIAAQEKNFTVLGWGYRNFPTGHDAMITAPKELTEVLLGIA
jgi:pimeloyl-ACP methyl ester carboxylesterase